jgi:hypothetical protein
MKERLEVGANGSIYRHTIPTAFMTNTGGDLVSTWVAKQSGHAEVQSPRKSAGNLQTPTTSVSLSPLNPGETLH